MSPVLDTALAQGSLGRALADAVVDAEVGSRRRVVVPAL